VRRDCGPRVTSRVVKGLIHGAGVRTSLLLAFFRGVFLAPVAALLESDVHGTNITRRVYVGAPGFIDSAASVGFGLFTIVALQFSGLVFYLRQGRGEALHSFLSLYWLIFVGANMLFLIVVGVWAGYASAHNTPKYAAAIAFGAIDFVTNAFMIVWTILGSGGRAQGGGFAPPPTVTTAP
jgi:hypothetical protein